MICLKFQDGKLDWSDLIRDLIPLPKDPCGIVLSYYITPPKIKKSFVHTKYTFMDDIDVSINIPDGFFVTFKKKPLFDIIDDRFIYRKDSLNLPPLKRLIFTLDKSTF